MGNSVQKYNDRSEDRTQDYGVSRTVGDHIPSDCPATEVVRIAGSLISPNAKTTGPLELVTVPRSVVMANSGNAPLGAV